MSLLNNLKALNLFDIPVWESLTSLFVSHCPILKCSNIIVYLNEKERENDRHRYILLWRLESSSLLILQIISDSILKSLIQILFIEIISNKITCQKIVACVSVRSTVLNLTENYFCPIFTVITSTHEVGKNWRFIRQ